MNLIDRTISFMNKYGVAAQKRFSQNFLIDEKALKTIINTIDFNNIDQVVEIGSGLGSLTFELVKKAKKLTSIEFDNDMIKVLSNELKQDNFTLIQNDFLKEDLSKYQEGNLAYIGNLPYQITRDLIKKICTSSYFSYFGFMVQKDLADELFYKVNKSTNNLYSAFLAVIGNLYRACDLLPKSFYPSPKVDSTFLYLMPTDLKYANLKTFKVLDAMFKNSKKTLFNNLKHSNLKEDGHMFETLNLSKEIRAHQLDVNLIKNIVDYYL